MIKSILIHECQHKSTRVNTNQHESDTSQRESRQVRHISTRISTSPTRVNMSQLGQEIIIVYRSLASKV